MRRGEGLKLQRQDVDYKKGRIIVEKTKPILNPYKQFCEGRKAVGLEWVTFHNLRHYRGTSWLQHGADIRSVQEKLGHRDIKTTMRYAHFVETHGDRAIREAQEREVRETEDQSKRGKNGGRQKRQNKIRRTM
jgi:integrase